VLFVVIVIEVLRTIVALSEGRVYACSRSW
jgi:hypothetical protein